MAPFYGWGSTASRLVPLRGGSLLFTTKFSDIPGTYRPRKDEKAESTLQPPSGFELHSGFDHCSYMCILCNENMNLFIDCLATNIY